MSRAESIHTRIEAVDVHNLFPGIGKIENEHREFLTTNPRYERFMTGEGIEEWVGMLGVDVLSLGHGYSTADVTRQFVTCNDSGGVITTPTEKLALYVAAPIHDFGEIKDEVGGVGDISHDKKQDTHREQETEVFYRLLKRHVPDRMEADFLSRVYLNIVHGDKSSGLARQFNAIERIGYLLTAHQAFRGVDGSRIANWKGLAGNVLSNQVIPLIGYSEEFPMVKNVLGVLGDDITIILDVTTASTPIIDSEGTLSFDVEKLATAQNAWRNFTAN